MSTRIRHPLPDASQQQRFCSVPQPPSLPTSRARCTSAHSTCSAQSSLSDSPSCRVSEERSCRSVGLSVAAQCPSRDRERLAGCRFSGTAPLHPPSSHSRHSSRVRGQHISTVATHNTHSRLVPLAPLLVYLAGARPPPHHPKTNHQPRVYNHNSSQLFLLLPVFALLITAFTALATLSSCSLSRSSSPSSPPRPLSPPQLLRRASPSPRASPPSHAPGTPSTSRSAKAAALRATRLVVPTAVYPTTEAFAATVSRLLGIPTHLPTHPPTPPPS